MKIGREVSTGWGAVRQPVGRPWHAAGPLRSDLLA